jgi:hypothetical protein
MGNILKFRKPTTANQAWERYSALVRQAGRDNSLWADRAHIEETFRAHEEFRQAFLASERLS